MSSKRPRKGTVSASPTERITLPQDLVRVEVRVEPLERPTASSRRLTRADAGKQLTVTDVSNLIRNAGLKPASGIETHVELSAAVPWVEGRGWLEAGETIHSWLATGPIDFTPDKPGQQQGFLKIWLDGLIKGHAYVAEIRVGGVSTSLQTPGAFHIAATDTSNVAIQHFGGGQTLSVFFPVAGATLSLIYLESKGLGLWTFHYVRVLHLGKLS